MCPRVPYKIFVLQVKSLSRLQQHYKILAGKRLSDTDENFFRYLSAFIIYWNHVKSEMADSYFTLSSSIVVKTDNKVKPIVSNSLYRFSNKKTWNDVFDEVTDPREVEKDGSNFSDSLGQSWTNIWARHGRIWCSKKKGKKEFAYLPTHTQKSWVGFGQTEIFLRMAYFIL